MSQDILSIFRSLLYIGNDTYVYRFVEVKNNAFLVLCISRSMYVSIIYL